MLAGLGGQTCWTVHTLRTAISLVGKKVPWDWDVSRSREIGLGMQNLCSLGERHKQKKARVEKDIFMVQIKKKKKQDRVEEMAPCLGVIIACGDLNENVRHRLI